MDDVRFRDSLASSHSAARCGIPYSCSGQATTGCIPKSEATTKLGEYSNRNVCEVSKCTGGADWYEGETGRVENEVGVSLYLYFADSFFFFPFLLHYPFTPSYPAPPPPAPCSGVCLPTHSLTHSFKFLGYLLKQAYFFPFFITLLFLLT